MFMLVLSIMLIVVVYFLFYLMSYSMGLDSESVSSYECGFNPTSLNRMTFSYRFFLISILFLIFDVEISLLLPIPFLVEGILGMWVFMIFMLILIVGLMYEYYCGVLNWVSYFIFKA